MPYFEENCSFSGITSFRCILSLCFDRLFGISISHRWVWASRCTLDLNNCHIVLQIELYFTSVVYSKLTVHFFSLEVRWNNLPEVARMKVSRLPLNLSKKVANDIEIVHCLKCLCSHSICPAISGAFQSILGKNASCYTGQLNPLYQVTHATFTDILYCRTSFLVFNYSGTIDTICRHYGT